MALQLLCNLPLSFTVAQVFFEEAGYFFNQHFNQNIKNLQQFKATLTPSTGSYEDTHIL